MPRVLLDFPRENFPSERLCQGGIPGSFIPTLLEGYRVDVKLDGRKVGLDLWDTATQQEFERLRHPHLLFCQLSRFPRKCGREGMNSPEDMISN
jgi:hypothetical protein